MRVLRWNTRIVKYELRYRKGRIMMQNIIVSFHYRSNWHSSVINVNKHFVSAKVSGERRSSRRVNARLNGN